MSNLPGRHYFQQRQRNRLYEAVIKVVEDAARLDGVRRKDIAEKIGSNPSQISRWLSGPSNWTIDSISDVLWAAGGELNFDFVRFVDQAQQNRSHSINDIAYEQSKVIVVPSVPIANQVVPSGIGTSASTLPKVSIVRE